MRFHDLRHSAASFMAAQGVHIKEAQRILGHAQVTTTMQVYTPAHLDDMRDALERVGGYLDTPKEVENEAI
jgi:integrase